MITTYLSGAGPDVLLDMWLPLDGPMVPIVIVLMGAGVFWLICDCDVVCEDPLWLAVMVDGSILLVVVWVGMGEPVLPEGFLWDSDASDAWW